MVKKIVNWMLVAGLLLLAGCGKKEGNNTAPEAKLKAPDFTLSDIYGKDFNLAQKTKGKIVIIDFWATWCPPCVMEIPFYIKLQDKYQSQGLQVVGISLDQDGAAVVQTFVRKNKVNYPVLMADDKTVASYGGIRGIPTTFLVDQQGMIVRKYMGYTSEETFVQAVEALLKPKP